VTRNLHRKLLLDDAGRVAVGVAAACMLFVVIAGLLLLARRMGGWRQLLGAGARHAHCSGCTTRPRAWCSSRWRCPQPRVR
jgi:uncharacterized iron-regulated membrane protein